MELILAIDQSTSATKAILFEKNGARVDRESVPHEQIYPRPGWVEHSAEEIWSNTLGAAETLVERNGLRGEELLCLCITNQRETFVVFDRETGAPLHNAIVWQCRRGDPICEKAREAGHEQLVREHTGLKIDTYFSAPKLKWLLGNVDEVRGALESGRACAATMDAFLVHRLTGGRALATDQTNACRTLLYDIGRLDWDEELCSLFGVPPRALPEVRDSFDRFGETDLGGLLRRPVPICGVMGDSQAALFAQRCFRPGEAKVTLGTGSSVLLNIGSEPHRPEGGLVTTIGWVKEGVPTYALEGIINCTGATVAWLRDRLHLIESAEETEALARSVSDNGNVYLVPAFAGLSAPWWSQDARGALLGLTQASTGAHVARAALESVAYQLRDVLDTMEGESEVVLSALNADGGMVGNRFLMQFIADIIRVRVRGAALEELSALGAAMAGALGMGTYSSLEEIEALPREFVEWEPEMPAGRAEELHRDWSRAVARVL